MPDSPYRAAFDATSPMFDSVTPLVWGPAGQSLAFALGLRSGERVLDICAGTGASALPAAAAVGPDGLVHAIDLSDDLLELGRLKATARALRNIDFVRADATQWEPPSTAADGYDALACSYGVFFLPDMDISFARLVRLVRPGGRVGVTVWRKGAIEAFARAFFEVVARYKPGRPHEGPLATETYAAHPLRRIETEETLGPWLTESGCTSVEVREFSNHVPATEEFSWNFVLGSGFRGAIAEFDDDALASIRTEFLELLTARGIDSVDATTLVATGVRVA